MKPHMDVLENAESLMISMELPGVKEEDIQFLLEKNTLRISAKADWGVAETEWQELLPSQFEETVYLPDNVDQSAIQADFLNGRLMLQLPKEQQYFRAA